MFRSLNLKAAGPAVQSNVNAAPVGTLKKTLGWGKTSVVALAGVVLVATTGALNGGTVPATSVFAPLKAWLQTNFLGSDWVIVIGFVALIGLIWQLAHGKGWGGASALLGILAAAILGPNLVVVLATATGTPAPVVQQAHPTAVQPAIGAHSVIVLPAHAGVASRV